jgi:ribonuclease BN (tRNA processing enzyme)
MKIFFLGTNGWYDTKTGNTTCILIDSKKYYIILDAGNGIHKIDRYVIEPKPVYLLLSHFHLDHIVGLHILNKFQFPFGLKIYGQKGTKKTLNNFLNEPFTVPMSKLPYRVKIHELPEGVHKIPFSIECRYLFHSSPTLGYRLKIDGKVITYCTDTGVCENVVSLSKDSDLLILECSNKIGQKNPEWPHLNPEDVTFIADRSNAKLLALMHFDAKNYDSLEKRSKIRNFFSRMEEKFIVPHDDFHLIL